MPIYRGAGSTGTSSSVQSLAGEAAASAAAAAASEAAASASATAAAASETAAAASETAADTSATDAGLAKDAAETAQAAAEAAQTGALAAQAAAELAYDNFDDRFLGSKASDPALDNDGNALLTGALYWNTSLNVMRVYDGAAWTNVGTASIALYSYIATSSQTVFTGADDNSNTLSFESAGIIGVYLNGVRLREGAGHDYTTSGGTTVTLTSGATTGDLLEVAVAAAFSVAGAISQTTADARYAQKANDLADIFTPTKGNILVGNGTEFVEVGVGSDGQALRADSVATPGVAWKYDGTLQGTANTTGAASLGTVSIPAGCTRIVVAVSQVQASTTAVISMTLENTAGAGSTYDGQGYRVWNGGQSNSDWTGTGYFGAVDGASAKLCGLLTLTKTSGTNEWHFSFTGTLQGTSNDFMYSSHGTITASGEVDEVDIVTSAGTFSGGKVDVFTWT